MLSLIKKELILQCIKEIEKTGNYPSYVNRIFQYGDDDDYDAQNIFNLELYKQFIIEKKKNDIDIDELFPEYDPEDKFHYLWGRRIFIAANIIKNCIIQEDLEIKENNGNMEFTEKMIFQGHLRIEGDLKLKEYDANIIVLGDLNVSGDLEVEEGSNLIVLGDLNIGHGLFGGVEYYQITVCGNLKANSYIEAPGEIIVGDKLISPFIHVFYNHGETIVLNGIKSRIFFASEHFGLITGESSIDLVINNDLKGLKSYEKTKPKYKDLKKILLPEIYDEIKENLELKDKMDIWEIYDDIGDSIIDYLEKNISVFID